MTYTRQPPIREKDDYDSENSGKSWAEYAGQELQGRTLRRSGKENAQHTWIERK